ncbi:MAG: bifunctional homocysteine S-methyltransferase/methylenetetrahydrofolate reductase [Actinobacteria bacterium]|nr:bifunctional homocysteine S-methyltransferase/methylenetetrahydrofolate reductase [Actinomycetota bacterium]
MASRFLERLQTGPAIVADGGMGSLISSAVPHLRCPEEANLRAPESVVSLHVSFIRAGADLIETNTFGANRRKLATHFLEDEFERINSTAVRLAREARDVCGREVFIAGSIGPLGEFEEDRARRGDLFAEQAGLLEGRGADLFMIETFFDLDELETAIRAVRASSTLPIVALLTFDEDGETLGGVGAREAAERLGGLELAAIGANHGAGPQAALAALSEMRSDGRVLAALPNVGLASMSGPRIVYPHATPDYFSQFAAHARELGAGLIGGCCGTTPAQITAIRAAIEDGRAPRAPLVPHERTIVAHEDEGAHETELARMLRTGEFVVSVQLDPPLGGSNRALLDVARRLKESGRTRLVDINDNARARARMNALMASIAVERVAGIETIPHVTSRDMTVMGLEAMLLGAHAEGIRNVLAITGDPPDVGDYPGSSGVYEVDAVGLCQLVSRLNHGENFNGKAIDAPTSFYLGVAVNPSADDLEHELERFRRKVEAGARFAMTQILFDLSYLDAFLERLGGSSPIPLLVGVWPLTSFQLAERLHNEAPGIVVPEPVQERLRAAGPNAARVGLELARDLLAETREKAAGAYLVAPFRQPLGVLDLLAD